MPTPPSPFTQSNPSLQFVWDSTSLGLLKECPRKYYLTIVQGYVSDRFQVHLSFGSAYHKALEIYEHTKFSGASHDDALLAAVQFCMEYGYRDDSSTFHPYTRDYTTVPEKTRETLLRSIIWYCEQFREDWLETVCLDNGKPAVELSFKIPLPFSDPDGEPYLLAGHIDRLVTLEGKFYFLDRKTTKSALSPSYFSQFSPSNQMSLYDIATQLILSTPAKGGIIDAAQIGVNFTRFARDFTLRTQALREEWMSELHYWISQAEHFATTDTWPKNDKSCGNYGGCHFQRICSRDPSSRLPFLSADFKTFHWNPLENRGDI